MTQNGQQMVERKSVNAFPSMPLASRTLPLKMHMAKQLTAGTRVRKPHRQQL